MRLREIFATNLKASGKPVRLRCRQGFNEFAIPSDLGPALFTCIRSLLFPVGLNPNDIAAVASNDRFECGVVFRTGEQDMRIRRGLKADSVRLQVLDENGRFEDRHRGAEEVQTGLSEIIAVPDSFLFEILNLGNVAHVFGTKRPRRSQGESWELSGSNLDDDLGWEESSLTSSRGRPIRLSPQQSARLREEYSRAVAIEQLEQRLAKLRKELGEVERDITDITGDDSELATVRHQLSVMVETDEISKQDWETLERPDRQLKGYERRLTILGQRLMKLRDKKHTVEPVWKNLIFLAGAGLAVVCTLVSILGGPNLRPVAFGNTICFAVTLFGLLQFFKDKEEIGTRGAREDELEQQTLDAEEARDQYEQQLAMVRRKYRVENALELKELLEKRDTLAGRERSLLSARRDAYQDQHYVAVSAKRHRLQEQIDELRGERESYGNLDQSSAQIAKELQRLGVPLHAESGAADGDATVLLTSPEGALESPFPYLRDMAEEMGLASHDTLDGMTTSLWGRMLSKLLDQETPAPQITDTGDVMAVAGQEGWDGYSLSQRWLCVESLLLAILMRSAGKSASSPLPVSFRVYPYRILSQREADALRGVYRTLAAHLQLLIFREA